MTTFTVEDAFAKAESFCSENFPTYVYYLLSGGEIVFIGRTQDLRLAINRKRNEGKKFTECRAVRLPDTVDADDLVIHSILHYMPTYNAPHHTMAAIGYKSVQSFRMMCNPRPSAWDIKRVIRDGGVSGYHMPDGKFYFDPDEMAHALANEGYMLPGDYA